MNSSANPRDSETALAVHVGRAVIDEVERAEYRYPDLAGLVRSCGRGGVVGEAAEQEERLGLVVLAAQRACAHPARLDALSEDERNAELSGFAEFVFLLASRGAAHLAPAPLSAFPDVIRRFTDGELLAATWWAAGMLINESVGAEGYAPIAEEMERQVAGLPERIRTEVERTWREIAWGPAAQVGRGLRAEAENGARRFESLQDLLGECVGAGPGLDGGENLDVSDVTLGMAALGAAQLCQEPDLLDRAPRELREGRLREFAILLEFVVCNRLWHLAPAPVDRYPGLIERYDDPDIRAAVCLWAASVVRESGDVERSLDLLLTLADRSLPPALSAPLRLHIGDCYRDLAHYEEARGSYALAEKAAEGMAEPDRATMLSEIAHQRDRLSLYSNEGSGGNGADRDDGRIDPNPFLPGSLLRDPEAWRATPARLLTLAQKARSSGDAWTAYRALRELADVVPGSHYELQVSLHSEAAELAQFFGGCPDAVQWHGFLAVCAAILCGSHRELGAVLSCQATRMANLSHSLPAFTLARWAAAADRVPLYSAGIQADIGYVMFRNGCLSVSKARYDAALSKLSNEKVRAERDLVAALLGEPAESPGEEAVTGRATARATVSLSRCRAALALLTSPADDVDTWEDLLLHSKGDMTQWSRSLQAIVDADRQLPVDGPEGSFIIPIDSAKARVFRPLHESGLLAMLDRYWRIPVWASAAWVLSGRTSTAMRERVGLEITLEAPTPGACEEFVPDMAVTDTRDITAHVDRLLALTFLPTGETDFGDAEDAAGLRAWAAEFLATHSRRLAFCAREEPDPVETEADRRVSRSAQQLAALTPPLQTALLGLELRKQARIASGPVRDLRAVEEEYLATLDSCDAHALRAVLDARPRSTDLLTSATDRHRAQLRCWFSRARQVTVDLVQGTRLVHLITCRSATIQVADTNVTRAQAQSAVSQTLLDGTPSQAAAIAQELRAAVGSDTEVSLRLRAPWDAVPVENLPDESGRALSEDAVVVRRHRGTPRFVRVTRQLPRRRVRVLGDPMGGTGTLELPGSLAEAQGIAELFGVQPHVRDAATWNRLRTCAREADLLWVSTHCEPFQDLGGTPALRLRDRWVLPSEIAALDVHPGLVVVLTVCSGGRGVSLGAVSGPPPATAFLDAGAALVISPMYPLRDTDWAPLIVDAARRTCSGGATVINLVRTLNATAASRDEGAPWVMHA